VDQLLGIVTALLLLAVVVAVLGIVNTLALSVVERTRELGLLRAVGATRRQVRTVVRRESVLMSLLGALTGLALGVASGVALARALVEEGITTVTVPILTLVVYFAIAVAVGVLAAVGPARRASRVDVLRAVTTD
jgi:putative ABC transport system permease protein